MSAAARFRTSPLDGKVLRGRREPTGATVLWQARGDGPLRVHVATSGRAATVRVRLSSGQPLLDDAALDAVASRRFHPVTRSGRRTAGIVDVPVTFKLED